ncbi:Polyphosphate kinase 2 (PPK2) [Rhodobacteraceae bacterium THAF1]|uniref:polyphosphate kinase 2 n=1 Tax=Palleronia sp. THAF1 TaxID=2587842 RepID=UPI000F3F87FF|nr:polyphosphate kinase 2 [Palleronia sp. THAF1]QFU08977.1 Polyphosphate kinase 2 (PPK2) [Palleronia sp. THAF1]VDC24284.1 Polyphosphate kinase 2 (PPK2) [Rhodobacteraceae bacterium THAF1]
MSLPFDGAISAFHSTAPDDVRTAISGAKKNHIVTPGYPYDKRMDKDDYEGTLEALQHQLVRLQADVKETGKRVVVVFEGRDAAGKGGTIKRFRENMNPRVVRTVALSKPTETEQGQWYFQRYANHLPTAGEIVLFDRSWYNRAVVEKVFDFCTDEQRALFFDQVNDFERLLVSDGITLVKIWLNVGRAEQLRRFLDREQDPLKQWKLSWIDVEGLKRWDAYTQAIGETFDHSHSKHAPWTVIRSDDKRRARIAAIQAVLSRLDYSGKDVDLAYSPDPKIAGGPEVWTPGQTGSNA